MTVMTRDDFLLEMDQILGLRAGSIRGDERLEDLENWDSTALISFIVMAQSNSGAPISLQQVVTCSTVGDLLRLALAEGNPQIDSALHDAE